jgi:hypothetical protein
MRATLPLLLILIQPLTSVAASPPSCDTQDTTNDSRDILCVIPTASEARRFAFVANFSGGHDDTSASIQASMDDQPLSCDDDSKMTLFAEDGDVSLYCRFSVNRNLGRDTHIKVRIHWSHAQYTNFELVSR